MPVAPAAQADAQASPSEGRAPDAVATARLRAPAAREAASPLGSSSAFGRTPATSPDNALRRAASLGDVAEVRAALARGADVHGADARGRNALMLAAQRGDAGLVRLLLEAGADPARTDRDGLTAADLARLAGHEATVLPLLDERAPR